MQALWTPTKEQIEATNLYAFSKAVTKQFQLEIADYDHLHAWSIAYPKDFWAFYASYAGIRFTSPAWQIISDDPMPYTRWFEGASLNYAEHLLFPKDLEDAGQTAIVSITETGIEQHLSYRDLRKSVAACVAALKKQGLQKGDRVAAFATNLAETSIVLLACSSLGLIFSSCSPDFAYEAAHARFSQLEPKLLFASPRYFYGGKRFDTLTTIEKLARAISSIEKVVLLPYPDETIHAPEQILWEDFLEPAETLEFEALPFDYPLYILFSSGTTGLPKAIVHRAGGVLLKHHSEMQLHCDIKPKDKLLYFTTCGWMMWNWLVSALAQAATIVQFEGSPVYPGSDVLWKLVEKQRLSFFGTSARYLHSLQAQAISPKTLADLSSLRTLASTGSPLSPSGFDYVYNEVKADIHLASISGGTDIVACFMLGIPTKPVYRGQIQGPALGVDMLALNEAGQAVKAELGELVIQQPLPSMPLSFWQDPEYKRYLAAYFEHYPGKWRHGDLIEITEQGGINVYGRSDATLNPGGVRIGTAELYRPLEALSEIVEACAIGKKQAADEQIWLLLILQEGQVLDKALEQRIKTEIRTKASPRHVPERIFQVSQLPRTRSGKAMEIAVSRLLNGLPIPNREVMANPEALEELAKLLEET